MKTLILAVLVACSAALWAGDKECADCACPEITQSELAKAIEAKQVVLIDVNGTESFTKAHIPGAIDAEAAGADLAKQLPADKGALVVAYCGGPKCAAWKSGASAAVEAGYTNVKHFKGGISGWKEAGGTVEAAAAH